MLEPQGEKMKTAILLLAVALLSPAISFSQNKKSDKGTPSATAVLYIAKFSGETKAASAVGAAQSDIFNALNYSNLFQKVIPNTEEQPTGAWALEGEETDYSGGSTAKRVMVGFGSGRAHLVMKYTLKNSEGTAVWTKEIKTEPSFFGSAGAIGAVQQQDASGKQGQKLVEALNKFFSSEH